MWGFLVGIILICLAVPPTILGAAVVFYRFCFRLNPPFRLIARTVVVSFFGSIFVLSVAIPIMIVFAPWLVKQPMVQQITHYDPKKTFQQNLRKISEQWEPYESPK